MNPPGRPFRHLCPEADMRDAMTDDDFWRHVTGVDMTPPAGDDWDPEYDWNMPRQGPEAAFDIGRPGSGMVVISDHVSPCPLCGEWGACGYDPEGRPMVHAFYDAEEGED